jgi:glycosyltransferase involved in cell wall biosynthesis
VSSRHVVVMVTTSYPRFPGDSVGTFMEPIAKHVAAIGHEVHVVAPWHPLVRRGREEDGVFFHFFRYAPVPALNVFGYAASLRADVTVRGAAWAATPLALAAGWFKAMRVAQKRGATVMHGHWVVPGGAIAAHAKPSLPLVVSLHGSDVFVAERNAIVGRIARQVFHRAGYVTACSQDLAQRGERLGASADRLEVVPYGVDVTRFRPTAARREALRAGVNALPGQPLIVAAGRLVKKKGFEYLIDALPVMTSETRPLLVIAGAGDLEQELRGRAARSGAGDRVIFAGNLTHDEVSDWFAAADVVVAPSIRDDSGNVDGLPNTVLEALASAAPLVATSAGGIASVVENERTGLIVPERDARAIAAAIERLLADPEKARELGAAGRALVESRFGWGRVAERLSAAYDRALAFTRRRR